MAMQRRDCSSAISGTGTAFQPSLAIAAAVSTMRFEKPHSLSYQLTHPDQLAFEHRGFEAVDGRALRRVDDVDRDERLVGVDENALQPRAFPKRP